MMRPTMSLPGVLSYLPLLPLALLALAPAAHAAYHPHHPQAHLLKRSLTTDAASVAGETFDFVIVGGGLAGLAVASRLSEWSNVTVLVIEAGTDGDDVETAIDVPGYSYVHSLTGSSYDWQYDTVAQDNVNDRVMSWPRGKGLGGSGAINGMFWCRASAPEYDAWDTLNPNATVTWNWDEVTSYINKAENFSQPSAEIQDQFGMVLNASAHGSGGPIQSGFSEYIFDLNANWIPAWENLGFTSKDLADGDNHGVMITPSTLNMRNGSRCDSKAGYIDPYPPRDNLVILTRQQVTGIAFNGTDADGNVVANSVSFQANASEPSYTVTANKEVILAGGTIGSAQVLQLSGIGPKSALEALGITSQVDLPVGYNLQDHISYSMYWSTPVGEMTWVNLTSNDTLQAEALAEWEASGTGLWTYINEAVGYVSLTDIIGSADDAASYAALVADDIEAMIDNVTTLTGIPSTVQAGLQAQYDIMQEYLAADVGQLELILTLWGSGADSLGIQVALQHPFSRGQVIITSTSAFTSPQINPEYFSIPYDLEILDYGSLYVRDTLVKSAPLSDVMITEQLPGATVSGATLSNYTRNNAGTEYHPLGTCAMLPQASGGVVDTTLTVYGTANVRVVDASIIPLHLSSHLMATTYGIAEKGADIIKQAHWAVADDADASTDSSSSTASASTSASTAVADTTNDAATIDGLSTGAKTGIGIAVGVGAVAIGAAALAFFLIRRKRNRKAAAVGEKGWYNPGNDQDTWDTGAAYKEAHDPNAYAMGDMSPSATPAPAFMGRHERTLSSAPSMSTMATTDLMTGQPVRSNSAYGLGPGARDSGYSIDYGSRSGAASPYRDDEGYATPGPASPQPAFAQHQYGRASPQPQPTHRQPQGYANGQPPYGQQQYTPVHPR
ncbi:hypothetical protein Q5752_004837 [Cryptotrichosporon argae]